MNLLPVCTSALPMCAISKEVIKMVSDPLCPELQLLVTTQALGIELKSSLRVLNH